MMMPADFVHKRGSTLRLRLHPSALPSIMALRARKQVNARSFCAFLLAFDVTCVGPRQRLNEPAQILNTSLN